MHKPVFCAWNSILRDIGGFDLKCNEKMLKEIPAKGDLGREGRTEKGGQNETTQGAQETGKPFLAHNSQDISLQICLLVSMSVSPYRL